MERLWNLKFTSIADPQRIEDETGETNYDEFRKQILQKMEPPDDEERKKAEVFVDLLNVERQAPFYEPQFKKVVRYPGKTLYVDVGEMAINLDRNFDNFQIPARYYGESRKHMKLHDVKYEGNSVTIRFDQDNNVIPCLLYTSDAADE